MGVKTDRETTLHLLAVAGHMASGKSTAARQLAEALDAELLVADEIRREDFEHGERAALLPGFGAVVYRELFERARALLGAGRSVVLDASFRTRALRAEAAALALEHGADFELVECRCPLDTCRARLAQRPDPEGWRTLFEKSLELWEPIDELPPAQHAVRDTSGPP